MQRFLLFFLIFWFFLEVLEAQSSGSTLALPPRLKDLEERLEAKEKSAFTKALPWVRLFQEAQRQGREQKKIIFAYFTRSYIECKACQKVEASVLQSPEFLLYAQGVIPYLHITSNLPLKPDGKLFQEKGCKGYPTFLWMDAQGEVLALFEGDLSVEALNSTHAFAEETEQFKKAYEQNPQEERAMKAYFLRKLSLNPSLEMLQKMEEWWKADQLTLEQVALLKSHKAYQEINERLQLLQKELRKGNKLPTQEDLFLALAPPFYALYQQGLVPLGDNNTVNNFWLYTAQYAARQKDEETLKKAYSILKEKVGQEPALQEILKNLEAQLPQ